MTGPMRRVSNSRIEKPLAATKNIRTSADASRNAVLRM
jgi:hypothetical protein